MKKAIITETNDKVLLDDNGTWEYVEKSEDVSNYSIDDLIMETFDKMTSKFSISFKESIIISNKYKENSINIYMPLRNPILITCF